MTTDLSLADYAAEFPPVSLDLVFDFSSICNSFTVFVPFLKGGKRSPYGWQKQRMRCLVRDNFTCQHPGCTENRLKQISVHHLVPRCEGGLDDLSNLITLCMRHHRVAHGLVKVDGEEHE
jgi:5-methylcytosine-specific restriction endonuclease McrA